MSYPMHAWIPSNSDITCLKKSLSDLLCYWSLNLDEDRSHFPTLHFFHLYLPEIDFTLLLAKNIKQIDELFTTHIRYIYILAKFIVQIYFLWELCKKQGGFFCEHAIDKLSSLFYDILIFAVYDITQLYFTITTIW